MLNIDWGHIYFSPLAFSVSNSYEQDFSFSALPSNAIFSPASLLPSFEDNGECGEEVLEFFNLGPRGGVSYGVMTFFP